jgi:histidinol-phosphatase
VTSHLEELADEAVAVARAAGDLTLRWFRSADLAVERKADGTAVTAADRAAERHVREHVAVHHPEDAIVGEEEGRLAGSSGRQWFVDPIDGTAGFVRGVPLYSTLVAVADEAGMAVGVIHLPALQTSLWACRGGGCWVDGTRAQVSTVSTLGDGMVTTSGYDAFTPAQLLAVRETGAALRTWGDGYGYYLVATGHVEAMIDPVASPWDLAPMSVIMAESGGRFSAVDGRTGHDHGSGLGTNGIVHDQAIGVMAPMPAEAEAEA